MKITERYGEGGMDYRWFLVDAKDDIEFGDLVSEDDEPFDTLDAVHTVYYKITD